MYPVKNSWSRETIAYGQGRALLKQGLASWNTAVELVFVQHPPGGRVRLSGLCLQCRHALKLGGGPTGTKGQRTSHGGAGRPALPSTATGNARARRQAGWGKAHFAWPLCGTPPPPRTWGLSPAGWGWGPRATSLGVRNPARGEKAARLAPPALTSRGVPPGPAP